MKTYTLEPTSHKDLFRVVDREGDWEYYFHEPTKRYLPAVNFRLDTGYTKGARFAEYLKNISPDQADRKLKAAGERGDRVHQYIRSVFLLAGAGAVQWKPTRDFKVLAEDNRTEVELSNDEWDCILAFQEFWTRHDAVLIDYEFPVWNLKIGYAGTSDAIIRLRKACGVKACGCTKFVGKLGLVDWKSSGGIYESYGAQVAAYANGENLKQILGRHKLEYTAIVRLGTKHKTTGGYEFEPYDQAETKLHFREFLAAVLISDAYLKPFDPEKEIVEIPDTLHLTVEREQLKRTVKPRAKRTPKKGTKVEESRTKNDET